MKRRYLVAAAVVCVVAIPLLWSASADGEKSPTATVPAQTRPALAATKSAARLPHVGASAATPPTPLAMETWFNELPRAEDLPVDVHFAPPAVGRAGERFGEIFDILKATPSFQAQAAQFFGRCTEDTTVLDGIRALCLHNWRTLRASDDAVEPRVDERIRRIADFLPKHPNF